jgi:hypothetical protein
MREFLDVVLNPTFNSTAATVLVLVAIVIVIFGRAIKSR